MTTGETMAAPSRLQLCRQAPVSTGVGLPVQYGRTSGLASVGNVQTCGLIWVCNVCAAKIRQGRAAEIDLLVRQLREQGGDAVMVTLTVRHHERQGLAPLLDHVTRSFTRSIIGTAAYRGFKRKGATERTGGEIQDYGIIGTVRAVEITYGDHGWHPHLHVLVLTDRPLDEGNRQALASSWSARWDRAAQKADLGPIHPVHGVKVTGGWAQYVAKVQEDEEEYLQAGLTDDQLAAMRDGGVPALPGQEMARADSKTSGKHPLSFDLSDGDPHWVGLWQEYVTATRAKKAITFSRGLRARFHLEEVDDEELAEQPEYDSVIVATISDESWSQFFYRKPDRQLLMFHTLEDGGPFRLWDMLEAWGVEFRIPPGIPADMLEGPWDE